MNLNRMLQEDVPYEEFHDASTYTAAEAFIESIEAMVKEDDILKMREAQCHMLSRFEKTNEMLQTFLTLSDTRYQATLEEFQRHTALVTDMKKDLDSIFRRIRMLKRKLSKQYPGAFAACSDVHDLQILEEDEEVVGRDQASAPPKTTKRQARPPAADRPLPPSENHNVEHQNQTSSSSNSVAKTCKTSSDSNMSKAEGQTRHFEQSKCSQADAQQDSSSRVVGD